MVAASLFLPVEREIVSVVKPRQQRDAAFVSSNPDPLNLRLAILVNQGTANEAEVFAATLRHHLAAKLVGTPTYGQGRVFSRFPLPDGSRLWLPTAHYQTPAGDRLDQGGLEPDVIVPLPRETERGLAGLGYGTFDWDRHRRQILETDRPLARAFEILSRHVE